MDRNQQCSIAYLMLVVFWWSIALAMTGGVIRAINAIDVLNVDQRDEHWPILALFLLTPIPACTAVGGLMLKMRLGFIVGCVISASLWLYVFYMAVLRFYL
jgi:hypothetical protein